MKGKRTFWIIAGSILAIVLIGVLFYHLYQKNKELEQKLGLKEEINLETWEDELNAMSIQYEGFHQTISNDSLIAQLETEQLKVQRLQEELRTVKSSNTKRINELKKEIETLRKIMYGYVVQIDSLDKVNKQLETEKRQVTAKYHQATQTVSQLTQEKEQLTETVQMASKLDASNISVTGITEKNKPTVNIKKMDQIEVRFTINKNITATPGEKTIYIRIQKPDDDVLVKSRSNVFIYENKEINYSAKRTIEYAGEEYPISIYWKIEEFLSPGTYRVDIFADGNRIGQKSFKLD
jgi:chromosome segregation ATPase